MMIQVFYELYIALNSVPFGSSFPRVRSVCVCVCVYGANKTARFCED